MKEVDNQIFSIITRHRSLDLKANDSSTRNRWVKYVNMLIQRKNIKKAPS